MKNILKDVRLSYISRREKMEIEIRQSRQEGKKIPEELLYRAEEIKKRQDSEAEAEAVRLYEELRKIPVSSDFPYEEPEDIEEITELFPRTEPAEFQTGELREKIEGAWLGRTAGCLLGQPVECWMRGRIIGLLKDTDNYPVHTYLSSDVPGEIREKYEITDEPGVYGNKKISWINNISCAPEDDDTNYTVMGLGIVEDYGREFTPMDVAEYLTLNVPVFVTCTAERMAYKNIVNGILPPCSAQYGNPYREWLGAQIRVDAYAYVNPGDPAAAAAMAVKDASVTHTKNGIYGAAFCAALIAESAVCQDADEAVGRALEYIPRKSRLHTALTEFLQFCEQTENPEKAIQWIHDRYDEGDNHDWCHVIPNDMIICLALHYGKKDFGRVIGLAVEAGFDTDCNAATAGSAFGMMYGKKMIPDSWTEPFHGVLLSRIGCGGRVRFEDLTDRCMALVERKYRLK